MSDIVEELVKRVEKLEAQQEKILLMLNGENGDGSLDVAAYQDIALEWNSELAKLGIAKVTRITGRRQELVGKRIQQYGRDSFHSCIQNIKSSDFLQGKNNRGWTVTFDWLLKPSNFPKVLEGNYNHNQQPSQSSLTIPESWGM